MTLSISYPENALVRLQRHPRILSLIPPRSIAWRLLTIPICRGTIANPNGHESPKTFQRTTLLQTAMYCTRWGRVILWVERPSREMRSGRGKLIEFGLRMPVDLGWRSMMKVYNSRSWLDSFPIFIALFFFTSLSSHAIHPSRIPHICQRTIFCSCLIR